MKPTLLLGWLLCIAISGTAQTYGIKFEQLGIRQGLSHNTIRAVVEDRNHNLFIGTDGGLNLYDGFSVKSYNSANSGFESNVIKNLYLLPDDRLAIITAQEGRVNLSEGLYILNSDGDVVRRPGFNTGPDITYLQVHQFYKGAFYTVDESRLWTYTIDNDSWTHENLPAGFHFDHLVDGFIMGSMDGKRCHLHVEKVSQILTEEDLPRLDSAYAHIFAIYDSIVHHAGFYAFENAQYDPIRKLIWTGAYYSMYAFDLKGALLSLDQMDNPYAFDRRIEPIQISAHGMLLIPTNGGLFLGKVNKVPFRIHNLDKQNFAGRQDSSKSVRGLWVVDTFLYMNIENCLARQHINGVQSPEILFRSNGGKLFFLYKEEGAVWSGRQELVRYDLLKNQLEVLFNDAPKFSNGLWSMFKEGNTFYLGGQTGVQIAHNDIGKDGIVKVDCQTVDTGQFQIVYQITNTNLGLFYVTSNGLFNASNDVCSPQRITFLHGNAIADFSHFTHLFKTEDQTLWAATRDGGTIQFRLEGDTAMVINTLDREDGLVSNTAYAVYPDEYGSVWISTDQGIVQLNKQDWSYRVYTTEDGLPDNEFNRLAHYMDDSGTIYFGGINGVVSFQTRDFFTENNTPFQLRILKANQFIAWDDTIVNVTSTVMETGRIIFHPDDKFIRFEVGLTDLFRTGEHRYEYRIQNVYDEWLPLNGNVLTINFLPYGKHVLELRARNSVGRLSGDVLQIQLIARRPFYLRWWFIVTSVLGMVIVVREYWLYRTRRTLERAAQLEDEVRERTATISKQAEELRELQSTRSRFFANISHELRTPLTLIMGPVQSLLSRISDKKDFSYLELIRQNAETLGERIDDLLLLSRMDSRQVKVKNETFAIEPFLRRVLDSFRNSAEEKNINLSLDDLPDSTLQLYTDIKKLEQILANFLSNAIKFTPEDGRIIVKAEMDDRGHVQIAVEDNGPGMSTDEATKVFDRFFQLDNQNQNSPGTGIGLSICKELAQLMHAAVGVVANPGEGSTFFVRIPVRPDILERLEETSNFESNKQTLDPETDAVVSTVEATLLLVEDNLDLQSFLRQELEEYKLCFAENGQQALDILRERKNDQNLPDCIISDVMMPVMDGFDMLKKIKSTPELNAIPVIMLTARAGLEDKLRGLRIGVDDYIAKPFDIRELKARIQNIISRIPARTETTAEQEPEEDTLKGIDLKWLETLEQSVLSNISRADFTMDQLADAMYISRRQMYRRIKQHTGLTANGYVREVRLNEARKLCEDRAVGTVAELAYAVGFEDPDYFSRIFSQRFGYRPSERL